ncbi:MAG: domain S-box protein [Segetibacter sp.]|nr:domain S-box protein [Segetibacter sp.]
MSAQDMLKFKHLPGLGRFILENHLDEFSREQLDWCYEFSLPLLRLFSNLNNEQVFEITKKSSTDLLLVLISNKAKEHLDEALAKWANNKHEMIGRFDVVAEDITLLNHIRQKGLKKWILKYTANPEEIIALNNEIDDYTFANNTLSTNTYINILTERLERKSNQLLEAQGIAQVGSFEWNFVETSRDNSPEMRKIFETEKPQSYEEMLEHVHPEDKEKVIKTLQQSLVNGSYSCEFRYLVNNKEKVLWTKAVIHYEDEKPVLMTGTVQDITERKKTEQSLLQKTIELEVSNSNLEKFAYVASHDLQEPLRKILMHTDLLINSEKERLSERGKGLLEKILSSTSKMKRLIKDILTYSTINPEQKKEKVNLEELLREVKTELEYLIVQKAAVIHSENLPAASVFPSQIKQLFQNLISNSIKFSKKDQPPVINITHTILDPKKVADKKIAPAFTYLQICITDNGIGFKKNHSHEIFSLFKRLHTQKEFEGSGLGLAICKKVAENHGGTIEASGEFGEGATFTIILPQP